MKWLLWKERLLCFIFPARCIFCNCVIPPLELCCDTCRDHVSLIHAPICIHCGCHVEDCTCGKHRRHYEAVLAPFYYKEAVRQGVLRLKRWDDPRAIRFFAAQMAAVIRRELLEERIDVITYVPMSKQALRRRGYNQSRLLAEELSKQLQLPARELLIKVFETTPQKQLKSVERTGNVLGVFDADVLAQGRTVLLVDDLMTTGATLNECSKMLKLAGATAVIAVTAAVTVTEKT